MKIGTEDKGKVAALAVFGLIALYLVYSNVISDGGSGTPAPRRASERDIAVDTGAPPPAAPSAPSAQAPRSYRPPPLGGNRNRTSDEFHPFVHKKGARPDEQQFDPAAVDPTLHTDLLAKVQSVKIEGGQRNLFQFGAAAPVETASLGKEPIVPTVKIYGPKVPPPPPGPAPPPPEPKFAFTGKYYGLATRRINNKTTGFFLDGEEIVLASEGMTVMKKYRIVRIGVDSVTLEDTSIKKTGTVPLSEDAGGTGNS
jgi:hypothetical protein